MPPPRCWGLRELHLLDYVDGDLDDAEPAAVAAQLAEQVRRIRPQVVVTFGPDGAYGHPDHIAISQYATAALLLAADAGAPSRLPPHRVDKLYYMVDLDSQVALYDQAVGELAMEVDGVRRRMVGWQPWTASAEIDGDAYWEQAWEAVQCHRSQLASLGTLGSLLVDEHRLLLGVRYYYRAYSLVNGGRTLEHDLFEGVD